MMHLSVYTLFVLISALILFGIYLYRKEKWYYIFAHPFGFILVMAILHYRNRTTIVGWATKADLIIAACFLCFIIGFWAVAFIIPQRWFEVGTEKCSRILPSRFNVQEPGRCFWFLLCLVLGWVLLVFVRKWVVYGDMFAVEYTEHIPFELDSSFPLIAGLVRRLRYLTREVLYTVVAVFMCLALVKNKEGKTQWSLLPFAGIVWICYVFALTLHSFRTCLLIGQVLFGVLLLLACFHRFRLSRLAVPVFLLTCGIVFLDAMMIPTLRYHAEANLRAGINHRAGEQNVFRLYKEHYSIRSLLANMDVFFGVQNAERFVQEKRDLANVMITVLEQEQMDVESDSFIHDEAPTAVEPGPLIHEEAAEPDSLIHEETTTAVEPDPLIHKETITTAEPDSLIHEEAIAAQAQDPMIESSPDTPPPDRVDVAMVPEESDPLRELRESLSEEQALAAEKHYLRAFREKTPTDRTAWALAYYGRHADFLGFFYVPANLPAEIAPRYFLQNKERPMTVGHHYIKDKVNMKKAQKMGASGIPFAEGYICYGYVGAFSHALLRGLFFGFFAHFAWIALIRSPQRIEMLLIGLLFWYFAVNYEANTLSFLKRMILATFTMGGTLLTLKLLCCCLKKND